MNRPVSVNSWGLSLADRVLRTAVYYRTNLAFRQIALLFGISKSAANRVVEYVARLLVLAVGTTMPGNGHDSRAYRDSGVDQ